MMNHMSLYPGPTEDGAIEYVVGFLKTQAIQLKISETVLKELIRFEIYNMGGVSQLGSQSRWVTTTSYELVEKVRKKIISKSM